MQRFWLAAIFGWLVTTAPFVLAQMPPLVLPPRVNGVVQPRFPAADAKLSFNQACSREPVEKIAALLAQGADPNGSDGLSPLREAVGNLDVRVVPKLLAAGAKPDASAMWQAGWLNKSAALQAMLTAGGKPDDALSGAAQGGHAKLVKLLLERGADPKLKSESGSTALHAAALQGGPETVRLLLAAGADANAMDEDGETPLHRSLGGNCELETIQLLVKAGAKLNSPNKEGLTPVRYAGLHRRGEVYNYLLAASGGKEPRPASDPNSPAAKKTTAALLSELKAAEAAELAGQQADREAYRLAQRELFTRTDLVDEILKRVRGGEKLSGYYGLLHQLGSDAEPALPLLVELLNDKEEVLSALIVMSSIKPGSFGKLPLERRQQTAANIYQAVHDPQLDAEEPAYRISALVSLGEVAVPHLIKLLRSDNPKFRYWTCDCLRGARFTNDEIRDELIKVATAPGDASTRDEAIHALSSFGRGKDPKVKAALLAIMQNPPPIAADESRQVADPEPNSFTAWQLCAETAGLQLSLYGPEVIDDLLPLMQTEDRSTSIGAIRTMERLDARAMPRLIELLGHDDEKVTTTVIYAARQKHEQFAIDALCAALDAKNERIVENAALALTMSPRREALPKLLEVAADQKRPATIRAAAASGPARAAINEPGEKDPQLLAAIPALIEVLEKGTPDQQYRAAETLGWIGAPAQAALPVLRKKRTEPDEVIKRNQRPQRSVKEGAYHAIQSIERRLVSPQP